MLLLGMLWALELMAMGMGWGPRYETLNADLAASFNSLPLMAVVAVVVALIWYVIAYFTYQDIIDAVTSSRPVTRQEQPELWNLLENLCISRGLTMPDLRICPSFTRNAWASGISDKRAVVTVTSGLLDALDKDEIEAVLAHELTHVINRDSRLLVICAIFAGVITLIAQLIMRMTWFGGRGRDSRRGGGALIIIALIAAAIGYVLALVIRMAISRRREFLADAGAVELTKNPDAMISALLKVEGHSEHIDAPGFVQTMFFDHHDEGFASLFETHPPISARVDALVKFARGHLPDWTPSEQTAASVEGGAAVPVTPAAAEHTDAAVPVTKRGPWG
jgi:heat shock protein HtpX